MNQVIWKFPIEVDDEQVIEVPYGAEFLSVQVQHGQPCLWAKVTPGVQEIRAKVVTVGTGHSAQHTEGMQYIGTYQLHSGGFVGHVFIKAAQQSVQRTATACDHSMAKDNDPICPGCMKWLG